ncbi:MAG TPA: helix-turn-helix transcriptional regulator [Solidesulfovibrio magneticus]|nr:helix-turn-helix transcriptional regulator [Solidesulfovibrio magneticus]
MMADNDTTENDAPNAPKPLPREVAWLVEEGYSPIRAWREHLGVTREELGRRLAVSPAAVTQMEARKSRPRAVTLKKIAAVLAIDWELLRAK